ncbi:MAG: DUF4118 domain-containing protein [Acidobacteria bacterium]|nr:DUF4118 domain-containing protein [Acidobacteriota bacterium]
MVVTLFGASPRRYRSRIVNVAAIVAPIALSALFIPFRTSFTNVAVALSMVAMIEALAILGTRFTGVLATLGAALWFDFFLTAPYEHFTINHLPDLEITLSIMVIGAIVTELAARSDHHRRMADQEAHFISLLRDVAIMAARNEEQSRVVEFATQSLTQVLELRACRFDPLVSEPPLARIQPDGEVVHVGLRWPVTEIGLPGPHCEILCLYRGVPAGRFVLTPTPGLALSRGQLVIAAVLVSLVAPSVRETRSMGRKP